MTPGSQGARDDFKGERRCPPNCNGSYRTALSPSGPYGLLRNPGPSEFVDHFADAAGLTVVGLLDKPGRTSLYRFEDGDPFSCIRGPCWDGIFHKESHKGKVGTLLDGGTYCMMISCAEARLGSC